MVTITRPWSTSSTRVMPRSARDETLPSCWINQWHDPPRCWCGDGEPTPVFSPVLLAMAVFS